MMDVRGGLPERLGDGREVRAGIETWIGFHNDRRPHQALAGRTPVAVWREGITGPLTDNAVT